MHLLFLAVNVFTFILTIISSFSTVRSYTSTRNLLYTGSSGKHSCFNSRLNRKGSKNQQGGKLLMCNIVKMKGSSDNSVSAGNSSPAKPVDVAMYQTYDEIACDIEQRYQRKVRENNGILLSETTQSDTPKKPQLLVGLVGPPGGGKSTMAAELQRRLSCSPSSNGVDIGSNSRCIIVPMDGFHYSKAQLCTLYPESRPSEEDSEESKLSPDRSTNANAAASSDRNRKPTGNALALRGAHWTFDGAAFVEKLTALRATGSGAFPSFDHSVGDPVEDDIRVRAATHEIVIVEGNYLLLDFAPWDGIPPLLDHVYFLDCALSVVSERVRCRHVRVGDTPERARQRVEQNDAPNAQLVLDTKHRADTVINSL